MSISFARIVKYIAIPLSIVVCSLLFFWHGRALGAYGDDSAGYIYLAGRIYHHAELLTQTDLSKTAIHFFGNEKLARWLIPTHYQYINPSGAAASKYPLGLSVLMAVGGFLFHSPEGFFSIQPLTAAGTLVGVYILCMVLFATHRYRLWIALTSVALLFFSELFFDAALSQPMREIPAVCFLVWAFVFSLMSHRVQRGMLRYSIIALAGLCFGIAVDIRETLILVAPALVIAVCFAQHTRAHTQRTTTQSSIARVTVGFVACVIALAPLIYNAMLISEHKVPFKKRDTGSVVVLSNIGHINTLGIENLFNNQGKFRPGEGSLPHYMGVITELLPIPFFGLLILYGLFRCIQHYRRSTILLLAWGLPVLLIYALWINPYSRYVIPLIPVVIIFAAYALVHIMTVDIPRLTARRLWRVSAQALAVIGLCAYMFPVLLEHIDRARMSTERTDRGLIAQDVAAIRTLDSALARESAHLFLLFTGKNQFGLSENFSAYTGRATYRFPLDQRTSPTVARAQEFFAQEVFPEYTVFAVIDSSTSADFYAWAQDYTTTPITSVDFSFQEGTRLVKITP